MTTTPPNAPNGGQSINMDDPIARFHYDAHTGRKATYVRDNEATEKAVKDLTPTLLDTFMKAGQSFGKRPLTTIFMVSMALFNTTKQLADRLDFLGTAPPSDAQFLSNLREYQATGQWPGQQGPASP